MSLIMYNMQWLIYWEGENTMSYFITSNIELKTYAPNQSSEV